MDEQKIKSITIEFTNGTTVVLDNKEFEKRFTEWLLGFGKKMGFDVV